MTPIAESSIPTLYANGISILLLVGIFYLSGRYRSGQRDYGTFLYSLLSVSVILNCVFSGFYYAFRSQETSWPLILRSILPTLNELSATVVLFFWVNYAEYRIYNSRDRLRRHRLAYLLPMAVVGFFTILNPFTSCMFYTDERMLLHYTPLYYVLEVVEHVYGFAPLLIEILYTKRRGKPHFFSALPVVIPVLIASVISIGTGYSARALGFSIGLVFLFMTFANRWRFDDSESGLYNRHFLRYMEALAEGGKKDYQNVIFFKTETPSKAFFEILKTELPKEGELIRRDENTVLFFTENEKSSMLSILTSLVQEAADEYDETHPEEKAMDYIVSVRRRKKEENPADFVKRVAAV